MSYSITEKFISKNRSGKVLNAVGSVVHETATPNASDENEQKYFDSAYRGASAHAFVDCDSITQTIPWNDQAWHAGGIANRTRIGIELCHYDDAARFNEVWKRAVWLFAWLHVNVLKITNINVDTLMSHAEVSARWKETNHQDPVRYFAQFGKTVDMFRAEVQSVINTMIAPPEAPKPQVNPRVKIIQELCNILRCTDENGHVLAVDGVVGKLTRSAVKKLPVIKQGSRCDQAVRVIQQLVGVNNDGVFGKLTLEAVKAWQKANGLASDGIVGPATWSKLLIG